ncbi:MAG TPA: hypothetical protein DD670_10720 [Planctomycetaceae bacterium]|nr:hypothetical protein [Planctomycetaceae bacterium]
MFGTIATGLWVFLVVAERFSFTPHFHEFSALRFPRRQSQNGQIGKIGRRVGEPAERQKTNCSWHSIRMNRVHDQVL